MRVLLARAVLYVVFMSGPVGGNADDLGTRFGELAVLTPFSEAAIASMPSDVELQRRGARIGRIRVAVDDVFENALSLSAPYRVVNSLHVTTHEATVGQQLLFRTGDAFDRRVLEETARLLRDQRYFSDASVETVRYNDDNTVDVLVRVHDVWTMSPGISFGRKGGENKVAFEFEDTNFLGFGKTISIGRSRDVDRSAWQLGYIDPHVFGSWWKLEAEHSTLSDGSDDSLSFGRPFYSLDSRWSTELTVLDSDLTMPRYSHGKQIERFQSRTQSVAIGGGVSRGIEDGWTTRYLFGARYDAHTFAADPNDLTAFIPADRRYVYPYVGIQRIEDAYVTTRNLNQIGRTEDLHLGRSLTALVGFAPSRWAPRRTR